MDLLDLKPIKKVPGEHVDRLLAAIEHFRINNKKLSLRESFAIHFAANGVLGSAATSLFESVDPDDTKALETLSRLWFETL